MKRHMIAKGIWTALMVVSAIWIPLVLPLSFTASGIKQVSQIIATVGVFVLYTIGVGWVIYQTWVN